MDEIVKQIKEQQNINFQNIKDQILVADLEAVFDGVNNSQQQCNEFTGLSGLRKMIKMKDL